uniref:ABC transporter C family member 5 n=1 Tax=Tanacetum cinerariifolium TaxID=118510 RepID=A0A6L2M9V7_TANCI|nr:ABC transporter C family member 5 [Tanacetum cinerariifolium]
MKVERGMRVPVCGSVGWSAGSGKSSFLCCILGEIPEVSCEMKVERGMRVPVCGSVGWSAGSGKSSFLCCILGEIPEVSCEVQIFGSAAYVSQSSWIQLGNSKVMFYMGIQWIRQSINLSGGQKQKVKLARALYQDADIYLLDDAFSAVDAHTGSELFKNT